MKILILEDSYFRIQMFKQFLASRYELHIFRKVEEAKRALDENEYETIFLDHDLDDKEFVDSDQENTGYQLAKYIAEKNIKAQVIIHSMNMVGSMKMKQEIPSASVIPFCNLVEVLRGQAL